MFVILPLLAACAPPVEVAELSPANVQGAMVFERAVENLERAFQNSNAVNITAQTAPCVATAMSVEEQYYLAAQPSALAAALPQILARPTAQFCLNGGAL